MIGKFAFKLPEDVVERFVNNDYFDGTLRYDGSGKCDINSCRLAFKFRHLNPKIGIGYRMKHLPKEFEHKTPHWWVEIKDKVWDFNYDGDKMAYLIWDKDKYYDFFGIIIEKEVIDKINCPKKEMIWYDFSQF
jgi:hypothetical protein